MPVRDKAVEHIYREVVGFHSGLPKAVQELFRFVADRLYVSTMDSIDWHRVMHDACSRHMALHDGEYLTSRPGEIPAGDVCAECLNEALVAREWGGAGTDKWEEKPRAFRPRFQWGPINKGELARVVKFLSNSVFTTGEEPNILDEDGHTEFCYEGMRDYKMVCHPDCPEYDGWIKGLA